MGLFAFDIVGLLLGSAFRAYHREQRDQSDSRQLEQSIRTLWTEPERFGGRHVGDLEAALGAPTGREELDHGHCQRLWSAGVSQLRVRTQDDVIVGIDKIEIWDDRGVHAIESTVWEEVPGAAHGPRVPTDPDDTAQ